MKNETSSAIGSKENVISRNH